MALNCENKQPDGEPCGVCSSCQRIWSGTSSLDVIEIDAASNRGVDDARELRERAMYAPSGDDRYKVYIVDEAHMLTREAWNALLKILEEPPPRVVFVFATTEPQKIAQAAAPVLSRLQRFDLKRISISEIVKRLETVMREEKITYTPEALAMLARAADGSMRDALSLTDQVVSLGENSVTSENVRSALGLVAEDEYLRIVDIIANRRAGEVFATVRRLADEGIDFGVFLAGFADMLRAQLALQLGGSIEGLSPESKKALESYREKFTAGDLLRMLSTLAELEPQFRKSSQQQLLVEMLLVRFALFDRAVAIEEILRGLSGAGNSGNDSGAKNPRPAERADVRARPVERETRRAAPVADRAPTRAPEPAPVETTRAAIPSPQDSGAWKVQYEQSANDAARPRFTDESVRAERLASLRAKDPVLDAAIDELDLELLD
jgi:DNA polymerase-3 subunit gamma/tau